MKRTFIAISITPTSNFQELFNSLKIRLPRKIRWSKTNKFHLTLGFFGYTSMEQEKQIIATLNKIAPNYEPFVIQSKGLGVFPSKTNPQIIWLGLIRNLQLMKIYKELWKELTEFGFTNDKKKFTPHITLGRIRYMDDKTSLLNLLSENYSTNMFKSHVRDILYYESTLTPEGPIYKILGKFPLN